MASNSPGLRRKARISVTLCALTLSLLLHGCDNSKSPALPHSAPAHLPHPATAQAPKLAIILDDVGSDPAAVDAIFALAFPLTLAILPNHPQSTMVAQEAHRRGYQVMLHLPMESEANQAPEAMQLHAGMGAGEISGTLREMLQNVPYAAGVNNHQGSRATSDPRLMSALMPLLGERNLFFVDSRTIPTTVAYQIAQQDGVRSSFRNVPFLDDVVEESAIRHQLELAIRGAKQTGEAIAIGHPHPQTLRVLREILPTVQLQGVELVRASALVH